MSVDLRSLNVKLADEAMACLEDKLRNLTMKDCEALDEEMIKRLCFSMNKLTSFMEKNNAS
jgi:hypothetical protein